LREKDFPTGVYGVIVVTRKGAKTISATLNSIMDQTLQHTILCVVDDGSTDDTPQLVRKFSEKFPKRVCLLALPNKGYDIRRVMRNINQGIHEMRGRGIATRYMMISGDDCVYPRDYAEYIIGKMEEDSELVVTSSDFEDAKAPSLAPQDSGRFIEDGFLKSLGDEFPPFYESESWVLETALQRGYAVQCFREVRYRYLRKLGSRPRFRSWGVAMTCLEYHPLWALYRCFKDIQNRLLTPRSLVMLWHYFLPIHRKNDSHFTFFEKDLRQYVWKKQERRLIALMKRLI